jgi:hypothetical protein
MAAAANYKFIESKRGGQTLVVDNYMFRVHSRVGTKKYWKCFESTCHVTAISDGGILVKAPTTAGHSHCSEEMEISRKDFRQAVKQQVNRGSHHTRPTSML